MRLAGWRWACPGLHEDRWEPGVPQHGQSTSFRIRWKLIMVQVHTFLTGVQSLLLWGGGVVFAGHHGLHCFVEPTDLAPDRGALWASCCLNNGEPAGGWMERLFCSHSTAHTFPMIPVLVQSDLIPPFISSQGRRSLLETFQLWPHIFSQTTCRFLFYSVCTDSFWMTEITAT